MPVPDRKVSGYSYEHCSLYFFSRVSMDQSALLSCTVQRNWQPGTVLDYTTAIS